MSKEQRMNTKYKYRMSTEIEEFPYLWNFVSRKPNIIDAIKDFIYSYRVRRQKIFKVFVNPLFGPSMNIIAEYKIDHNNVPHFVKNHAVPKIYQQKSKLLTALQPHMMPIKEKYQKPKYDFQGDKQARNRFDKLKSENYFNDVPSGTYIALTGKSYIGYFDNVKEASRVGNAAAAKLGEKGLTVLLHDTSPLLLRYFTDTSRYFIDTSSILHDTSPVLY